jgi:SHS2 domain-containing protein
MGRFDILEHTADTGILARGASLGDVLEAAARGMLSLMVPADAARRPAASSKELAIEASGEDGVELLVAWLHEILFAAETEHLALRDVSASDCARWHARGKVTGEPFDPDRHGGGVEIKAVTWHEAYLKEDAGAWEARVYFDI